MFTRKQHIIYYGQVDFKEGSKSSLLGIEQVCDINDYSTGDSTGFKV
jgi:hypothetical protein